MTWYIVRHAHKELGDFYNSRLHHQDEPLSAKGYDAVQKLASYFAGKRIAAIYVSGYRRTWQTAEGVAERLQLTPVIDERLNEIDNGQIDGMLRQAFPAKWAAFVARTVDFRFPGGETGQDVRDRIITFEEEKRRQHAGQDILIVAHEGLIRSWMCYLMELQVDRRADFQVDYCGLMEIDYQEEYGRWKLIRFNQACV